VNACHESGEINSQWWQSERDEGSLGCGDWGCGHQWLGHCQWFMVGEVLTVEFFCGDLYSVASTRVGQRKNERSNGMLAFIFHEGVVP